MNTEELVAIIKAAARNDRNDETMTKHTKRCSRGHSTRACETLLYCHDRPIEGAISDIEFCVDYSPLHWQPVLDALKAEMQASTALKDKGSE